MKKLFVTVATIIFIASNCLSQSIEKNIYLQKSKNQKTTAWVLAGTGSGLFIAGVIVGLSNASKDVIDIYTLQVPEKRDETLQNTLVITGGAVLLSSIPFFISSRTNKKKAISVTILTQPFHLLKNSQMLTANYPALSMKIRL
jgi:MFS-type transporter involved in bile tolerance (Atg22 family)